MRLANRMRAVSLMVSACQASRCVRIIQPRPISQSAFVLMARLLSLKGRRCGSCCRCAVFVPSQAGRWFPKCPIIVLITIKNTRLSIPVNLSVSDPLSKKGERSFTSIARRGFFLLLFLFFFFQCNNPCTNLVRHFMPLVCPLEPFVRQRFPKVSASGFSTGREHVSAGRRPCSRADAAGIRLADGNTFE